MELSIINTRQGVPHSNNRLEKHSFIYSLLIHGLLVTLVVYFSPKIEQSSPVIHQIINAKLYNLPRTATPKSQKLSKETNNNKRTEQPSPHVKTNTTKSTIEQQEITIKNTQDKPQNNTSLNTAKAQNDKRNAIDLSLDKLSKQLIDKAMKQGAIESYKEYVEEKNTIPKSTTRLNQLPEPKAVEVNVNCDNALSKGLTVISGLMGGTIRCNINKDFQKYIDARLEKMGKKAKKN